MGVLRSDFISLREKLGEFIEENTKQTSKWYSIEIEELKVITDHAHILCSIPLQLSISEYAGMVKGKSAIKFFQKKRYIKEKPNWGNQFWSEGILLV